ncbi:MAG: hypothetical protein ABIV39_04730 [Verrucomicrobiota bacterium]
MKLEEAVEEITKYSERMNALYGSVVFDEWAVVSFEDKTGRVLAYSGPRKENFQSNFSSDVESLKSDLLATEHATGDFDFARHAGGTRFDAFMVLGDGLFLICNNTMQSIHGITKDSRWLGAQVPFAELTEKFRADSLVESR